MKFLILEDSQERIVLFKKNFKNVDMTFVETPQQAIDQLQRNTFDAMFFDHDLGGTTYAPSDEKSGYEAAKWLRDNPSHKPWRIFIHSLNDAGAKNIESALPEAKRTPFVWMSEVDFGTPEDK